MPVSPVSSGPILAEVGGAEAGLIVAVAILLLVSAVLVMAEVALNRLTITRAQTLAERGGWGTKHIVELASRPEHYLNTVMFSMLACQLVQATLVGILADRLFGGWGLAVAAAVNVVIVFVVGVAVPRTWAIEHPDRASLSSVAPVRLLAAVFPLRFLVSGLIGVANAILPGKGLKEGPFVSEEDFLAIADKALSDDVIEAEERELIEQVIEFGDTICREVMVPRPDMLTAQSDEFITDAMEIALNAGRSRLPICGDGIDDIVGIAYVKDMMRAERSGRGKDRVSRISRAAYFVPETKRIAELLPEMQARKTHMAVVVDEYGGVAGLVTLEDLIEELIGEIVDEFDREDPMIERLPDGVVRVQARMAIDEVGDLLEAELPDGDWDTIGGLMFHLLGHVPYEGETIEVNGFRLRAERVQGRRIGSVRLERITPSVEEEPSA
jgi:putative hemolysin